jgi:hypothetical protein
MPFIRGRYHINPIMGQALEAARAAEAALRARQNSNLNTGSSTGDDSGDGDSYADANDQADGFRSAQPVVKGPVHRVEIEAAELVPHSSGRATRGFVVRVHHAVAISPDDASATNATGANDWRDSRPSAAPAPETHVFADHGDLVDFLRDALAPGAAR